MKRHKDENLKVFNWTQEDYVDHILPKVVWHVRYHAIEKWFSLDVHESIGEASHRKIFLNMREIDAKNLYTILQKVFDPSKSEATTK
jgi:hypothetical protein